MKKERERDMAPKNVKSIRMHSLLKAEKYFLPGGQGELGEPVFGGGAIKSFDTINLVRGRVLFFSKGWVIKKSW